jgi:lipopolysaccharide export system permease protein
VGHSFVHVLCDALVVLSPVVSLFLAEVQAMKLLTRYLRREIYASIALVFGALIMLFALLDLINELNSMGRGDYKLGYVLLFVTLTIPGHVYELFPVAVLIGTIFAMVQMAANSELTVYRSSGVSLKQMIVALLKIGAPLVVLCFLCGEFVAPPSERLAQQTKLRAQNLQVSAKEFRSGVWVKDERSFVNVKGMLPDTSLMGVSIFEFDDSYHLRSIISAEHATYLDEQRWSLEGVRQTNFDKQSANISASVDNKPLAEWRSTLNPDILSVLLVVPEQMSAWHLRQYTEHLRDNHQKTTRYEIAMWNKLVYPFAVLVMMLLALPFSAYQRRTGGISGKIFMGIVLGLSFHFIGRLFANVGALNEWSPLLSATAMSWLFLALALGMLWRTERR